MYRNDAHKHPDQKGLITRLRTISYSTAAAYTSWYTPMVLNIGECNTPLGASASSPHLASIHTSLSQRRERSERKPKNLISKGVDPVLHKREQKHATKVKAANSFERVAREWHERQKDRWTQHHAARVIASLEREVFAFLGDKPIQGVTAPEILEVVRKIEQRDALNVAARVPQRISSVFRYSICCGYVAHNPASDLKGALDAQSNPPTRTWSRRIA
jgi:hypothetical protein